MIKDIPEEEEILWDYSVGYLYNNEIKNNSPLTDNQGLGSIHYSIMNNDRSLFKKCIQKQSQLNLSVDYYGWATFPEHWVIDFERVAFLRLIIKKFDLTQITKDNVNILHSAFFSGNEVIILYLIKEMTKQKVDIGELLIQTDIDGNTPIDYYIENKKLSDKVLTTIIKYHPASKWSFIKLQEYYTFSDFLIDYNKVHVFKFLIKNKPLVACAAVFRIRSKSVFKKWYQKLNPITKKDYRFLLSSSWKLNYSFKYKYAKSFIKSYSSKQII